MCRLTQNIVSIGNSQYCLFIKRIHKNIPTRRYENASGRISVRSANNGIENSATIEAIGIVTKRSEILKKRRKVARDKIMKKRCNPVSPPIFVIKKNSDPLPKCGL